jgi:tRNA pseudouridine38-40 synthase
MTRWFKLTIAYDGREFEGWQRQKTKRTVQFELEKALARLLGKHTTLLASGRTDTGVHALGQVVSFDSDTHHSAETIRRALCNYLPDDIAILRVQEMAGKFRSIADSIRKRYRYVLQDGQQRDVFARHYAWHSWRPLHVEPMREAAQALLGTHDFVAFEGSGSRRVGTIRTIYDIAINRFEDPDFRRIHIEIEADGFLYNMVRNIVGTLVDVGCGRRPISHAKDALDSKDRTKAGMTAPPQGLYLLWVKCREPGEVLPRADA